MRKYVAVLSLSLFFLAGRAQNIDKELIYGKWKLYSMDAEDITGRSGISFDKDSLKQTVAEMIHARKSSDPNAKVTQKDSIDLIDQLIEIYGMLFQTYVEFDRDGHTTMLMGFEKDSEGNPSKETGTYTWTGKNTIAENLRAPDNMTFVIYTLTSNTLILKAYNETDKTKVLELKFRK
jgi:hypothetical protein